MKKAYYGLITVVIIGLCMAVGLIAKINKMQSIPIIEDDYYRPAEAEIVESNYIVLDSTIEKLSTDDYIYSYNGHDESDLSRYTVQTEVSEGSKYFLIGDSRIVGLNQVTDISSEDKYDVLAKVGEGYYWLSEQELPSDKVIVSFLGVNDLGNVQKYISYYNSILQQGYRLVLITVGPVDEDVESQFGYSVLNEDIDEFNKCILNGVNCEVLDLNTYLELMGYSTIDGVHYTQETYRVIYDFIIDNLK